MKKLGKILLVTLSILVSVILIEYIYSQRWRLQKSADVSEYEELIVGEWEQDTKKYYLMNHLLDLTVEKKYLKIKSNFNYEVYSKPRMVNLIKKTSNWNIKKNLIEISGYEEFMIPPAYSDEPFVPEKEYYSYTHPILFLNQNVLVFNELDDDLFFFQIPRKKVYYRTP